LGDFNDAFGHLKKLGCRLQHGVIDAGEFNHKGLDWDFGVDQADELVYDFVAVEFIDGNFGNAFFVVLSTGGFYVKYCVQML